MIKWIKIIGISFLGLFGLLIICSPWIMKEAFGPKYRTVEIMIDDNRTLKCVETYNADLHNVFYDVDFSLDDKTNQILKLGKGEFADENWAKDIHFYAFGNWFILPVCDYSYAKILLTNKINSLNKDTILSPLNLRYDSIWKKTYDEIPAWTYSGTSKVDSVAKDKFYVTYEYRIGDYQPFQFYSQTIEYRMDTVTANLTTIRVYARNDKNNSR
ncbi:MAG: hypothetical protein ACOVSR_02725 [Bacteroidia bacterium]